MCVQVFQKLWETDFCRGPDHEDDVNETHPTKWFSGLVVEEIIFQSSHEQICIRWVHTGTHSCAFDLEVVPVSETEAIVN